MAEEQGTLGTLSYAELPRVAELEAIVFPEPLGLAALKRLYRDPSVRYLAIREGGRLAAYFGFQVAGPTAHVLANVTDPLCWGRGYGGRILREAEPLARAMGARWFLGEVRVSNTRQQAVLRRIGWREIGRCPAFFGNGEDAIVVFHCFDEVKGP